MKQKIDRLRHAVPIALKSGRFASLLLQKAGQTTDRIHSDSVSYVLRRDGSMHFTAPKAKIPILVRPSTREDLPAIALERPGRVLAIELGLSTCYLATTEYNQICYMQFLVDSSQNKLTATQFKGIFPMLKDDEMFLEWAYTFEKFRGMRIMASAMAQIAERGIGAGARWLFTSVAADNESALKGCKNAGFRPYQIVRNRWRFFRHIQAVDDLVPDQALYPFEQESTEVNRSAVDAVRI